ncbi:MAG: DUF4136 domain-containing protein [Spirosomaceae bacterium]|nr:DUF4136 domain-containing protein [Spirosomataceae bacterium]
MKPILFSLLLVAFVAACNPDPIKDLSAEDSQVFITNVQSGVNWKSYATFALPDSVLTLNNQRSGIWNDPRASRMVNLVTTNMTQRGYRQVMRHQSPDLAMNIIGITNTQNNLVANPNPWLWDPTWGAGWGWGSGWGPGWGWGGGVSVVQSSETYWYVEIVDRKNALNGQQPRAIWNAQIRGNGLLDDTLFNSMIGAIFSQSSYINKN